MAPRLSALRCDAVVLAGGRASDEMAQRTGTPLRALFPYRGQPFVHHVCDALRGSAFVDRIAVIGPLELRDLPDLAADLVLVEHETVSQNLFAGLEALQPRQAVLVTASDNPLLSAAAFDDFLSRVPDDADAAYPYMPHAAFLARFPCATNTAIQLRDGTWIGGDCIYLRATAIEPLRNATDRVLAARKSLLRLLALMGWGFACSFALRRIGVCAVETRVSEITGVRFRFVPDCDPVFAIDIDDPVDWDYLQTR